jgi:predicted transcriptional regulator
VGEALSLIPKRAHGLAVVVENGQPLGTVSEVETAGVDRFAQVHQVMSGDLLTITPESSPTETFDELTHRHLEVALVVENGNLLGVMTRKHALRSTLYRPAVDSDGRLMIGAAVGINGDVANRAEALFDAGIDVLVVDSTHVLKTGSDVNTILFEILPALASGVYIHFHDVFYPFEYPREWAYQERAWNEVYALRAFLQYNDAFEIVYFNHFFALFHAERLRVAMPLCATTPGSGLWLRKC